MTTFKSRNLEVDPDAFDPNEPIARGDVKDRISITISSEDCWHLHREQIMKAISKFKI